MEYLVVEDERFAYEELLRMMTVLRPEYRAVKRTISVTQTIEFLKSNTVDFILMDIRLADGSCFDVFNHVEVVTPVIFTTAYDKHAVKAFKLNSVDYLLKPFDEKELERALVKFENFYQNSRESSLDPKVLRQLVTNTTKNRFLISKGDHYHYVEIKNIAHFYSEQGVVFLHTFQNKRYIVNYTLDQLEPLLDPQLFLRVSRNCIAQLNAIENVAKHFNSRLKLNFSPKCPHEVLVSRVRVPAFLKWMDGIIA